MKKRIVYSLFLLFLLFSAGVAASLITSYRITSNLESVISLHKIEIIRQNFVINVQTVQSNLYTLGTAFGKELDVIVENVFSLDQSIESCLGCHHEEEMTRRLKGVKQMTQQYKEAISYLVTSTANEERIGRLKMVAVGIGDDLLSQSQEMAIIAEQKLNAKTVTAVKGIQATRGILIVTLILELIISLVIAASMTKKITTPVAALLKAARMIGSGHLGYTTDYRDRTEFGELAESFNAMSTALKEQQDRTQRFIEQLAGLYRVTLPSYRLDETEHSFGETCRMVAELFRASQAILVLQDRPLGGYAPHASAGPLDEEMLRMLMMPADMVRSLHSLSGGEPFVAGEGTAGQSFPFISDMGGAPALAGWLTRKSEILGLVLVSGREERFSNEDMRILTILANHLAVAVENVELFGNLEEKMQELRETQEQLIQSAKLAAIGELASNVAHEINNPLTSIIGYAEILLDEDPPEAMRQSLDIIEKESLRAREIVRQLLNFARKKELLLAPVDLNSVLGEVMLLMQAPARKARVHIAERYGEIPEIVADADQLKQVFLNIMNNAVAAMENGGELSVETESQADHVAARFRDSGAGIGPDVLSRIFEPFFTTKKEKGTGLGLSISYRIIQDHGGRIDVESEVGKGTTFTVRLPQRKAMKRTTGMHA